METLKGFIIKAISDYFTHTVINWESNAGYEKYGESYC